MKRRRGNARTTTGPRGRTTTKNLSKLPKFCTANSHWRRNNTLNQYGTEERTNFTSHLRNVESQFHAQVSQLNKRLQHRNLHMRKFKNNQIAIGELRRGLREAEYQHQLNIQWHLDTYLKENGPCINTTSTSKPNNGKCTQKRSLNKQNSHSALNKKNWQLRGGRGSSTPNLPRRGPNSSGRLVVFLVQPRV